jgi:hypothetical protein
MGIKVDSLLRDRFDVMRYKDSRQVRVSCNLGVSPFEVIFYEDVELPRLQSKDPRNSRVSTGADSKNLI